MALFRSRVWRPALVRAGLLGQVVQLDNEFEAVWGDADGVKHKQRFRKEVEAVTHVVRHQSGGLRFHDLRHSYGTWLEVSGIAFDASFRSFCERRLPGVPGHGGLSDRGADLARHAS